MRHRFRRDRRRLDRVVTFLGSPTAANEFNEITGDWVNLFETRCAITPAPGTEKYANRQNASEAPLLIEVREEERTLALTAANRAVIGGKTYEIVGPPVQPVRGANIILTAVQHEGA